MYQNEYRFLRESLPKSTNLIRVYYLPRTENYQDYATTILRIFIVVAGVDDAFEIVSPSGCTAWSENFNDGRITCSKLPASSILDDVASSPTGSVLVYERGTAYGERLEKSITALIDQGRISPSEGSLDSLWLLN